MVCPSLRRTIELPLEIWSGALEVSLTDIQRRLPTFITTTMVRTYQVTLTTAPEVHLVSAVGLVIGGTKTVMVLCS